MRISSVVAFTRAALRYWLGVFPRVSRRLRAARERAAAIPDPSARGLALAALEKRGNIEGAAAFAALLPRRGRRAAIDALCAFQSLYNYTDALAESQCADPAANARCLHTALLDALEPCGAAHADYLAHVRGLAHMPGANDGHARDGLAGGRNAGDGAGGRNARDELASARNAGDEGYLLALVDACRDAYARLPGGAVARPAAARAARRIARFQELTSAGEGVSLERWALEETPAGSELEWWETVAAAGSSLVLHAAIAQGARRTLGERELEALEDAYFPWISALHSLLDSLVDRREDASEGQLSLVGCYATPAQAAARMRWLAARAAGAARSLPSAGHEVLLAGMVAHYLSALERGDPERAVLARELRGELGGLLGGALAVYAVRGRLRRLQARPGSARSLRGPATRRRVGPRRAAPPERLPAIELEDA